MPHHPVTCIGETLRIEEDGVLECEHVATPPNDRRTKHCIQGSISVLLWECLFEREGTVIK